MVRPLAKQTAFGAAALCALSLAACATPHYATSVPSPGQVARAQPAPSLPQTQGRRQVGKPYQIRGKWYTPHEDPDYDETGLASWYGSSENGNKTANGETFDMSLWTAAHKTLPLPSMVEVTNLENGKSMQLRVNDRGPFVDGRIIDLSKAAAEELGVLRAGVAKVRVRYLGPAPLEIAGRTLVAERREPAPVSEPVRAAPQGQYEVQAGTFAVRENAERAASQIAAAGPAEIRPLDRDGLTLWRVVVGSISDPARAAQVRDRVVESGFTDARIVGPF